MRPASEVLLSMYGSRADLANLDNVLHRAAGLEAEIKVASVKASDMNSVGLSGVVAVLSDSDMNTYANGWYADVLDYMSVTDLNGVKSSLIIDKPEKPTKNIKTIEVNKDNCKELSGGYIAVTIPDTHKRNVKVSNEVGEVSVEYEQSGDEVKVTYTYNIDEQLITKNNYRQFYSLMSECKDMNNYTLIFK